MGQQATKSRYLMTTDTDHFHDTDDDFPAPETEESPDVEGLDQDALLGDYPIDTMLIRNENRTVFDIVRRIEKGTFIMDPEFQRDFIWKEDKQSKLIESVIMRIPLPVFYLAEDEKGRNIVVDGLQRLSTFRRFMNGGLRLNLPDQPDLHKKRFDDLSPKFQNRIEDCNLVLYIIDVKVPERARLDIFERVNSGIALTRQQMRNCLYTGPATAFLKEESQTDFFLLATGESLNSASMRDREFINRFCAFDLIPLQEYRGEMDHFLADGLRRMNSMNSDNREALRKRFRQSLVNNYAVFHQHAFRKHHDGQDNRSVINASLWDVMTTGLSRLSKEQVLGKADILRRHFFELLNDPTFNKAITYGTNGSIRVNERFGLAKSMFNEVFND